MREACQRAEAALTIAEKRAKRLGILIKFLLGFWVGVGVITLAMAQTPLPQAPKNELSGRYCTNPQNCEALNEAALDLVSDGQGFYIFQFTIRNSLGPQNLSGRNLQFANNQAVIGNERELRCEIRFENKAGMLDIRQIGHCNIDFKDGDKDRRRVTGQYTKVRSY
jgi:hypothetical protein